MRVIPPTPKPCIPTIEPKQSLLAPVEEKASRGVIPRIALIHLTGHEGNEGHPFHAKALHSYHRAEAE